MKNQVLPYCLGILITLFITSSLHAQYSPSTPLSYTGKSNMTIANKSFTSGAGPGALVLSGCSNVKIINCSFSNIPTFVGIHLSNCTNIEIVSCTFNNFYGGVYAFKSSGINVHCNSFTHIVGPKPRGQIVQFNGVTGGGNKINYNISEHTLGTGNPEDLINCYATSGIPSDPIQIIGNKLRGGGPSTSGGGIIVGDNAGHDFLIADNILVDPGQYGIGVPAGSNIVVKNNRLFAKQQSFTNVGIYVGVTSEPYACKGSTIRIEGNQVNWTNKLGKKNGYYNCPCCPGVIAVNNNWNATFNASILPSKLSLNSTICNTSTTTPNKLPTISLTAPSTTSFIAPSNILLSANATDADGTISKVEFYNGSTLLSSDLSAPYSFSWNAVGAGTYSITARATDNKGGTTSSNAVLITVRTATTPTASNLVGPACGTIGKSGVYTLDPSLRINATSYSWWYSGSAQSVTPLTGQPYSCTLYYGNSFSKGEICVGVNYSKAPWFKQYCLSISANCGAKIDVSEEEAYATSSTAVIAANPTSENFRITPTRNINLLIVQSLSGATLFEKQFLPADELFLFGSELSEGNYILTIVYEGGEKEYQRLMKIK